MFGLLNSFGIIPDILMGKKPKQAVIDNVSAVGSVGAMSGLPGILGSFGAPNATNAALIESAAGTPGYGASSASSPGLLSSALGAMDTYGKPLNTGLSIINNAKQATQRPQVQPMPMPQQQPVDVIGQMLAQQAQLDEQRRKQRYGIA